jgi:transposase
MRGKTDTQVTMLTLITADQLVPEDHPIRQIKPIVDKALSELSPTFNRMYAETGRPSMPRHFLRTRRDYLRMR